jgi:di/tricarboxylate transporter
VISLYKEFLYPAAIFLIATSIFVISGILTPLEALAGFSNEQIAVIILLLILSNIIRKTSVIDYLFNKLFKSSSYRFFLMKMMLSVSSSSAFLNNTPIVAILTPHIHNWGIKNEIPPSKLLIPLSYAAILGGTATLIGTSTNLIVNGLTVETGLPSFHIFDFAYVGVPLIIFGGIYMITIGCKLLPSKKDLLTDFIDKQKEYIVETIVFPGSPLIGKTITEGKLRNLRGLFLAEILRKDKTLAPASPDEVLEEGDVLIFAGVTETIIDLINSPLGLSFPNPVRKQNKGEIDVIEAIVSNNSTLSGKKIRNTDFREIFDAAILAVHRNGEKLSGKIGEIELRAGDLLLLISGKDFLNRIEINRDLYVISKVKEIPNIEIKKASMIVGGIFLAILLAVLGVTSLFKSLLILLSILVITNTASIKDVRRGLDLNLIVIAAFSLAIGKAMLESGTAELIAHSIISIFQPFGTVGILLGVYLVSNILTSLVTNIAAVSIAFPIAYASALSIGLNPVPFILAVAFGASATFLNPFGYQTNLIVFGPGGYNFKDFLKVGIFLSAISLISCISILSFLYKLT